MIPRSGIAALLIALAAAACGIKGDPMAPEPDIPAAAASGPVAGDGTAVEETLGKAAE